MSTLLIEGGHRLEGRVAVEGNKNAALPLLAACLLTEEECVLTNVPRIGDVEVMARLLLDIGAEVEGIGTTTLRIRTPRINTDNPDRSLVGRLRGSVLLLGPLLARTGRAHIAPPVVLGLAKAPGVEGRDLALRVVISGAAPMDADTANRAGERLGARAASWRETD